MFDVGVEFMGIVTGAVDVPGVVVPEFFVRVYC
jgi:hypothetical protein